MRCTDRTARRRCPAGRPTVAGVATWCEAGSEMGVFSGTIVMTVVSGVLATVTGCSKPAPPLVTVRGTLLLDGRPLAGKSILFSPEEGTPGLGAGANSRVDGAFELLAIVPGSVRNLIGVSPGVYRVVVSEPLIAIESTEQSPSGGDALPPAVGFRSERIGHGEIPAKYRSRETTPLIVEVTKQTQIMDIDLRGDR